MLKKEKNALLSLLLVAAIWGISSPIIKYTLRYIPPTTFLFIRFLFSALILYFLVDWKKHNYYQKLKKKGFTKVFLLGVLGSAVSLLLVFYGIEKTTAIEATIIASASPILVVLGGATFLKEKVSKKELLGILITLLGFSLVIIKPLLEKAGIVEHNGDSLTGNLLLVVSTIAWASYLLISKNIFNHDKSGARFSPTLITFITFFAGAVVLMPYSLYEIITYKINYSKALPGIIYMTIFSSVIAYSLYEHAIKKIDAGKASLIQYTTPIFTIPVAMFFLKEKFSLIYVLGGTILILGIFISETAKVKRKTAKAS